MTVSLYRQIGSHSFVDFSEKGRKWLQVVKRSSLGIVSDVWISIHFSFAVSFC